MLELVAENEAKPQIQEPYRRLLHPCYAVEPAKLDCQKTTHVAEYRDLTLLPEKL